jgi:hypothetical protein
LGDCDLVVIKFKLAPIRSDIAAPCYELAWDPAHACDLGSANIHIPTPRPITEVVANSDGVIRDTRASPLPGYPVRSYINHRERHAVLLLLD